MKSRLGCNASPFLVAILLLCTATGVAAQETEDTPVDLGLEEQVDVNFVLIDFMVLDRNDRPVPDLTVEDFKLKVGGVKTPIANLDRSCGSASEEDPPSSAGTATIPLPPGSEQSRIVLVFDYHHMLPTAEVFDRALEMLDKHFTKQREHMIVSFSGIVRIEAPFTTDPDELRWTLRRMRNDRDLFARHRSDTTELQFFDRIRALFDLLERWTGRKTVVFFSGPFTDNSFDYDTQYRELASHSAAVRAALYPVDSFGLRTLNDPHATILGGPSELRRLASETGGRMTADTNDIGMGYVRAQRDLSCVYTLGFYDPNLMYDRNRRLTLKIVRRQGLRAVYPEFYVVRSEEEKQTSLVKTAVLAPHMFESDEVQVRLFVTGAQNAGWRTVAAVEVRLDPRTVEQPDKPWDLRGFLRKPNGTIVHKFTRKVKLPEGAASEPTLAHAFEEAVVPPGDYALSIVLSHSSGEPRAATLAVTLPPLPRHGPFLIGPLLGRRSGSTFVPLIGTEVDRQEDLDSLTVLCLASNEDSRARPTGTVTRWISDLEGDDVRRFDDTSTKLRGSGTRCREIIDTLGAERLEPGEYEIHASAVVSDWVTDVNTTEFTIRNSGDAPPSTNAE